jgi:uncharacterized DUF497 family protein
MQIKDIIWLPDIIDKLDWKHHIAPEEVEQVFDGWPMYRRIERGKVSGEDLYAALGQTDTGRYLIVFFIHKTSGEALIISARDMEQKDRRQYERKK